MARLSSSERAKLPDTAYAYVDSGGRRRLPINDASHVRNALARFGQVQFESDAARQKARQRLLAAAKRHGIVPIGFMESELRNDRRQSAAARVVIEASRIRTPEELETELRRALDDPSLSLLVRHADSWTGVDGHPVAPPPESTSTVAHAGSGGASVALVHDRGALSDPEVADAVLSAARFVVERHRLETDPTFRVDRSRLPSGILTHLFTDIEGSTELLTELDERYAGVLSRVRRIIRQEVRRHAGHEVDCTGDATYSVFQDAAAAIDAAVSVQRCLAATRWPAAAEVRVRMGLHTGEVTLSDAGYVGLALNTAARVMSAGHGGQILLTPSVRTAISDLPDGVSFRSLGVHALKDLPTPVELLQAEAEGLTRDFPRLRRPHR